VYAVTASDPGVGWSSTGREGDRPEAPKSIRRGNIRRREMGIMFPASIPVPPGRASSRTAHRIFIAAGAGAAAVLAAVIIVAVNSAATSALAPLASYSPTAEDGLIAAGSVVTVTDTSVPAIDRLNPALREAFRQAESAASDDGIACR
jgi:hypothetical protein